MRYSTLALASGLALLAGCSHHESNTATNPSPPPALVGWKADALKQALDADTGDKKPYTCTLDFAHAMRPSAVAAVTIPGLIERVDDTHATVQASSPELAEKAIHAAAFVYQVLLKAIRSWTRKANPKAHGKAAIVSARIALSP